METQDPIRIKCTNKDCGARFKLASEKAGKKMRCPRCKAVFRVPKLGKLVLASADSELEAPKFKPVSVWIQHITAPPPCVRTALRWTCLASLVAHLAFTPLIPHGASLASKQSEEAQTEYMKKTQAAKAAKILAPEMRRKLAVAPPPPDPEDVVTETMTQELTTDVEKMVGGILDVSVTNRIAERVKTTLKEELQNAAVKIAEGEYSEEELAEFKAKVTREAHTTIVKALSQHRDETQVERAQLSVTEWYERSLGKVLKTKIRHGLFGVPGRQYSYGVWPQFNQWGQMDAIQGWSGRGYNGDLSDYPVLIDEVSALVAGRYRRKHHKPIGKPYKHGWHHVIDWPKATESQAESLQKIVRSLHAGESKPHFRRSWFDAMSRYLQFYRPHEAQKVRQQVEQKMKELWAKAEEQSELFMEEAYDEAEEEELKEARDAILASLKEIVKLGRSIYVKDLRPYHTLNRTIRSRVLRGPKCKEMYGYFVESMIDGLEFGILDLAHGQFKEGIRIRRKKTDKTRGEFAQTIMSLLRRDIKEAYPGPDFATRIFSTCRLNPYKSKITGRSIAPTKEQIEADEQALMKVLSEHPELRVYVDARTEDMGKSFKLAIDRVKKALLAELTADGRLKRGIYVAAESVDFQDKVLEKLDARKAALEGRGQDMAKLTESGVPETSAAQVALMRGARQGAGIEPVMTTMFPAHITRNRPMWVMRGTKPKMPPRPTRWGFVEQAKVKPDFKKPSPRFEAIPFLPVFPRLDGDLADWGKIRPLVLGVTSRNGPKEPFLVYAAWNYQGFFFGYRVKRPRHEFTCPPSKVDYGGPVMPGTIIQSGWGRYCKHANQWVYKADHFRLLFDTVCERGQKRGTPWTQEFVILPRGSADNPDFVGVERIIESRRDATVRRNWRSGKSFCRAFPAQPATAQGPDGTGPFRVTKLEKDHYTTEVFLPRSLFKYPVFAPGWILGFECIVAVGAQPPYYGWFGKCWASPPGMNHDWKGRDWPNLWGDLMLLGTDARLVVQDADESGSRSRAVIPGHSYLITVMDPDRNVNMAAVDTVLVSVEGTGSDPDVEVFVLKETGKNTSTFRGYVNTQPGITRSVPGTLEVMPGDEIRFGYVDFANARGEKNVIYEQRLPVVTSLLRNVAKNR